MVVTVRQRVAQAQLVGGVDMSILTINYPTIFTDNKQEQLPLVSLKDIAATYEEHQVFQGVNLDLYEGMLYTLTGPSGAGKTTFLNLVLGLLDPSSGSIVRVPNLAQAAVFQENRLCEELTVIANLALVQHFAHKQDKIDFYQQADELLGAMGMPGVLETFITELSGGMKRRVCLARALLVPAQLYVFDEPLKGLDAATELQVMRVLASRVAHACVLWSTHHKSELEAFGTQPRVELALAR